MVMLSLLLFALYTPLFLRCADQDIVIINYGTISAIQEYVPTSSPRLAVSMRSCIWPSEKFDLIGIKKHTNHVVTSIQNAAYNERYATHVALSATAQHIIAGSLVKQLYVSNIDTHTWKTHTLSNRDDNILSLRPSPREENKLAYTDTKENMIIYDIHHENTCHTLENLFRKNVIRSYVWHTQEDGFLINYGDSTRTNLSYWDMREKKPFCLDLSPHNNTLEAASPSISISPDGTLCTSINNTDIIIFDLKSRKAIATIPSPQKNPAMCAGFIDSNTLVYCVKKDATTVLLNIHNDAQKYTYELQNTSQVKWDSQTHTLICTGTNKGSQLLRFFKQ